MTETDDYTTKDKSSYGTNGSGWLNETISFESLARLTKSLSLSNSRDKIFSQIALSAMGKLVLSNLWLAVHNIPDSATAFFGFKGQIKSGGLYEKLTKKLSGFFDDIDEKIEYGKQIFLKDYIICIAVSISEKETLLFIADLSKRSSNGKPGFLSEKEVRYVELLLSIAVSSIANLEIKQKLLTESMRAEQQNILLRNLFNISRDFSTLLDVDQIIKVYSYYLMGHLQVSRFAMIKIGENDSEVLVNRFTDVEDSDLLSISSGDRNPADKITLIIPVEIQGNLRGTVLIGPKLSGIPHNESDIEYLTSLSTTAYTSLENAELFAEKIKLRVLEGELEIAKMIQGDLLPKNLPDIAGYRIGALNKSAKHVGGDYYDVIPDKEGNFAIVMADVSGKGVPASLIMANLQSAARLLVFMGFRLETIVEELNTLVCDNTAADKFVTMCFSLLKPKQSLLKNCTAGHPPPFHLKVDDNGKYNRDNVSYLEKGGMVLGVVEGYKDYVAEYQELGKGDIIVYYTDGFTDGHLEGKNGIDIFLRVVIDNLNKYLDSEKAIDLDSVIADIIEDMSHIEGILPDDMTILLLHKK